MPEELTAEQAAARLNVDRHPGDPARTGSAACVPAGAGRPEGLDGSARVRRAAGGPHRAVLATRASLHCRASSVRSSAALRDMRRQRRVHARGLPPLRPAARAPGAAGDDDRRDAARHATAGAHCRCTPAGPSPNCAVREPIPSDCSSSRHRMPTRGRSASAKSIGTRCTSTRSTSSCSSSERTACAAWRRRTAERRGPARSRGTPSTTCRPGSTLQTGIGSIPNQIATLLAEGDGGEFGLHSEMFTDGCMRLHQAGKVTNTRKGQYDGVSVTTFAFGSPDLYAWLNDNSDVAFLPVEIVNAPEVIADNDNDGHRSTARWPSTSTVRSSPTRSPAASSAASAAPKTSSRVRVCELSRPLTDLPAVDVREERTAAVADRAVVRPRRGDHHTATSGRRDHHRVRRRANWRV